MHTLVVGAQHEGVAVACDLHEVVRRVVGDGPAEHVGCQTDLSHE